jgi:hypothetical protein
VWYALGGSARLWSGGDKLTISPTGEGGGLDVARRMRVRQGGDASAGIWFFQTGVQADRAFVGMSDDTHVGFWGNTGVGWGLVMNTSNGAVNISGASVDIIPGRLNFGTSTRQMINLWSTNYGIGIQAGTQYYRSDGNFAWFAGGTHNDATTNPGGGRRLMALNGAGDLILSARTNPSANPNGSPCRALVDLGNQLVINFANDYSVGVQIASNLVVTGNAFKPGGGSWGVASDIRRKQHVQPLVRALDKLLRLRGVSFEWKEPEQQGNLTGPQMGLIADEVEEVFPEWISADSEGYKQLTVRGFEALVVEAFRTLKAENDHIKVQNQTLETRMMTLEAKLQAKS